jgi:hypothetical protein
MRDRTERCRQRTQSSNEANQMRGERVKPPTPLVASARRRRDGVDAPLHRAARSRCDGCGCRALGSGSVRRATYACGGWQTGAGVSGGSGRPSGAGCASCCLWKSRSHPSTHTYRTHLLYLRRTGGAATLREPLFFYPLLLFLASMNSSVIGDR